MPKYTYLIFDVDDTLLDFYAAFSTAQKDIADKLGIEMSEEYRKTDEALGWKAWDECGLNRTDDEDVQKNYHKYYFEYIKKHFAYLSEAYGRACGEQELTDCYLNSVSSSKVLKEADTLSVYEQLSKKYKLILATNGLEKMQKERLTAFLPYTYRLYISEEIGFIKPTKEFFNHILTDLKCRPNACIIIGDSITNDIIGAKAVGMDVCYYNPKHKPVPDNVSVDYEIDTISALTQILP